MFGYDVTFTIMGCTRAAYWVGGERITGSDFGPEIDYNDGHSSSSSSVTLDKFRDRTLNQATTASFHTVSLDAVQSEIATGGTAKQAQTLTARCTTKASHLLNISPAFYATPNFITEFTTACSFSLSVVRLIKFATTYPV
jgi:hypothetical protein